MTDTKKLEQAYEVSVQMLNVLEPNGKFTFQTFMDDKTKTVVNPTLLHGAIQDVYDRLIYLNNQGCGVFVTVNQTDLNGRKLQNIKRVRALWLDFDVESTTRQNELLRLDFPPSMIIESSPNKHHAYWVLNDSGIALDQFTALQRKLIANFDGADKGIHDLPRVMRLAGFYHLKGEPFMTHITHVGEKYSSDTLIEWVNSLPNQIEDIKESKQTGATKLQSATPLINKDSNPSINIALPYEKAKLLARGRWIEIFKHLNINLTESTDHRSCPICGGIDRFRFDNKNGDGTFICSQGDGTTLAGDGFKLLSHSGMDTITALSRVNAVLAQMGLIGQFDGLQFQSLKPLVQELGEVQKLSADMLPNSLARYVFKYAHNADKMTPDFCAVNLLVCLGSIIGAKVSIKPKQKNDYELVPNLWGGVIAPPSSKKTHGISLATRFIDDLQVKEHKLADHNTIEADKQQLLLDSKVKSLQTKLNKDIDDAEKEKVASEICLLKSQQSEQPKRKYLYLNDATPEALAEKQKNNPNGILVIRDELVGLFISLDKNDGDGRTYYLEGWNGVASYQASRIGRGDIFIENHCLSVLGGIQPSKLFAYLEDTIKGNGNDGLLQRFQLLIYPDVQKAEYVDEYTDKQSYENVKSIFAFLHALDSKKLIELGAFSERNERPYFRFNEEAQKIYQNWFNNFYSKLETETHEIIQEHLGKYVKLIGSLSLIFHLVKIAETKQKIIKIENESANY